MGSSFFVERENKKKIIFYKTQKQAMISIIIHYYDFQNDRK